MIEFKVIVTLYVYPNVLKESRLLVRETTPPNKPITIFVLKEFAMENSQQAGFIL